MQEFPGDGVEEALEQEDVERVGDGREPDRPGAVEQVALDDRHVEHGEVLGDDEDGRRDHQGGEHHAEDGLAEHGAQLGERVGGGDVQDELEGEGAEGVVEGVEEEGGEVHDLPGPGVVPRCEAAGTRVGGVWMTSWASLRPLEASQ
ncbi:hypothetical protein GCM10019017_01460 [Streptomyces showdoensis]